VIVTAPLGVLKTVVPARGAIRWQPPLPTSYTQALAGLEAGPVLKAALTFETPFWERLESGRFRGGAFFRAPQNAPFSVIWTILPLHEPVLYAWAGGPAAQRLIDTQSALMPAALATISAIFGPAGAALAQAELSFAHCEDWQRDPFSRGAYSYVAVDGMGARAVLRKPLAERVYFAGEALADGGEGGTVAGALVTGTSAARSVFQRMNKS
jgi:monoamine oxidase